MQLCSRKKLRPRSFVPASLRFARLWIMLLLITTFGWGCRNQRFSFDELEAQLSRPTAQLNLKDISRLRSILRGTARRYRSTSRGGPPSLNAQLQRIGIPEGILHRVTAFSPLSNDYRRVPITIKVPKNPQDKDIFSFPLHPCYDVQKTRLGYRLTLQLSCTSEGSGVLIVSLHGWNKPQAPYKEIIWRYLSACDRQGACVSGRMTMRSYPTKNPCPPEQKDDQCLKSPQSLHRMSLIYLLTRKRSKRRNARISRGGLQLRYRLLQPLGPIEHLLFLRRKRRLTRESFVLRYNPLQRITQFEIQGATQHFLCEQRDDNTGSCKITKR
ncbi:MAG: hypothetical protein H6727_20630 [Myxococcales bacterium]|nr:hypothetical protein [Myxococcales bacterium]